MEWGPRGLDLVQVVRLRLHVRGRAEAREALAAHGRRALEAGPHAHVDAQVELQPAQQQRLREVPDYQQRLDAPRSALAEAGTTL